MAHDFFVEARGVWPFSELQSPMCFTPPHCRRLQSAAPGEIGFACHRGGQLQGVGCADDLLTFERLADAVTRERLPRPDVSFGQATALPLF
jgi:hypothetical protein